jgi:Flp pilus assembly protein TadB
MSDFRFYFPGVTLILIAIAIIAVPEILVAFIAAAIIMIGIALLYMGHIARRTDPFTEGGIDGSSWFAPACKVKYFKRACR